MSCKKLSRSSSKQEVIKMFWSRAGVGISSTCWPWKAGRAARYGVFGSRFFKSTLAHRVAYELRYAVKVPKNLEVCHSCDNPRCVNPLHLFLGTQKDNMRDAMNKGRLAIGQRHSRAKLTEAMVREIRSSKLTQVGLAKQYGVRPSTIWAIIQNKTWRHLNQDFNRLLVTA